MPVGFPAYSPAALSPSQHAQHTSYCPYTVPAPPWCTTADICGNSQSCGHCGVRLGLINIASRTASMKKYLSVFGSLAVAPQPHDISSRTPAFSPAVTIIFVKASAFLVEMLPNPT